MLGDIVRIKNWFLMRVICEWERWRWRVCNWGCWGNVDFLEILRFLGIGNINSVKKISVIELIKELNCRLYFWRVFVFFFYLFKIFEILGREDGLMEVEVW